LKGGNDIPAWGATPVWGLASVTPLGMLAGWRTDVWRGSDERGRFRFLGDGVIAGIDGQLTALPGVTKRDMREIAVTNDWIALQENETSDRCARSTVNILDFATLGARMRITIDGADRTGVRIQADRLIVFDSCGRVILVSLSSGAVLREHRLT
jgi:hypothetical protein